MPLPHQQTIASKSEASPPSLARPRSVESEPDSLLRLLGYAVVPATSLAEEGRELSRGNPNNDTQSPNRLADDDRRRNINPNIAEIIERALGVVDQNDFQEEEPEDLSEDPSQ